MDTLSIAQAAEAIGVTRKQLDRAIQVRGRQAGRQGRSRTLTVSDATWFALAFLLRRDLGMSLSAGLSVAERLVAAGGEVSLGGIGTLRYRLDRLAEVLSGTVADARVSVPVPTRGRPPRGRMHTGRRADRPTPRVGL